MPTPSTEALTGYPDFTKPEQLTTTAITDAAIEAVPRLEGVAIKTPVITADWLGEGVSLKDETQQPGRSFKRRGSGNAVGYYASRGAEMVVTSSAGSHGEGIAAAARHHDMDAVVFVSHSATVEKRGLIGRHGADVRVMGHGFDEALVHGIDFSDKEDGQFVHPFANPLVIAGQGTMGLELLREAPDMTHLVMPVGGGGMLSGVGSVVKEHRSDVKVIAVQVERSQAFADSLKSGKPAKNQPVDHRFEGIAVSNVDPLTLGIGQKVVDRVMVIPSEEVYRTIFIHRKMTGTLLETAGAVAPTAARMLAQESDMYGAKIVAVASGANPPAALGPYVEARARRFGWSD